MVQRCAPSCGSVIPQLLVLTAKVLSLYNPDETKNGQNTGKISFSSSGKFWLPLHLYWLTRKCWTSSGGDLLCRISSKSDNKYWNCGQKLAYALQAKYSCHCPNLKKKPRLLDNFLYRTPTPNNYSVAYDRTQTYTRARARKDSVHITRFRRVRKISKSDYWLRHVRPHGTTQPPLDGFRWNMIFELFSKICRENSSLEK
jgi:hypothetical protein